MHRFGKQVEGAKDRTAIPDRDVDAGPKAKGRDQGVIEEIPGKFRRGVSDKGLTASDGGVIPAVPFQRLGAKDRVFGGMRRVDATVKACGIVQRGYGEKPGAKRGTAGVKVSVRAHGTDSGLRLIKAGRCLMRHCPGHGDAVNAEGRMLYKVSARRVDATGSLAMAHGAEVALGTDLAGRPGAMNPVELLLSALAACMIKGVERVTPTLKFQLSGVDIRLEADRQDAPPKLVGVRYEIVVGTGESDARLDLLHRNILKYGTISNTLAAAVPLTGTIRRA